MFFIQAFLDIFPQGKPTGGGKNLKFFGKSLGLLCKSLSNLNYLDFGEKIKFGAIFAEIISQNEKNRDNISVDKFLILDKICLS